MKKLVISFIALSISGCSYLSDLMPTYKCYSSEKAAACLLQKDYDSLITKGYSEEDIKTLIGKLLGGEYTGYCVEEIQGKCRFNYTLTDIEKVEKTLKADKVREEKEQAQSDKQAKEVQTIEKKYSKKFCSEELHWYGLSKQSIPKNCLLYAQTGYLTVMQQAPSGTLVNLRLPVGYSDQTYFVVSNSKDSGLADDQAISQGIFENVGTYQYTSVTGATRTVVKLKRLQ